MKHLRVCVKKKHAYIGKFTLLVCYIIFSGERENFRNEVFTFCDDTGCENFLRLSGWVVYVVLIGFHAVFLMGFF